MAAYYPEKPTEEEKVAASTFIRNFMEIGIEHEEWGNKFLRNYEELGEPDVSGTEGLSVWMCRQHNQINLQLRKPQMSCDYEALRNRWGGPTKH